MRWILTNNYILIDAREDMDLTILSRSHILPGNALFSFYLNTGLR
ncbi:hypothetical protein N0824_00139 [Microcystis sp. 0824]|nr:hypothetical protein N0824_00139 [Microcystis sp. 0824]